MFLALKLHVALLKPVQFLVDIFKPILIGIKQFFYFRVYNRWGQLVYSTTTPGKGWDGMLNGKKQEAGAYVWSSKAIDYLGKTLDRKGSVVLIR